MDFYCASPGSAHVGKETASKHSIFTVNELQTKPQ